MATSTCSQSSVGASASNSINVDGPDADVGLGNAKYPLWAHATKLSADPTGRGGNKRFQCHFRLKDFPGSYLRVRAHFLKIANAGVSPCQKLPHDVFVQLQKENQAAQDLIEHGPTRSTIRLPPSKASGSSKKRKTGKQQGIVESFDLETKQQADALIARMYFTGGVPFNLARNPYYRESYRFIASHDMGGYVPPGYNALRTTLLDKEKKDISRMLEPTKSTWPLKGVTICTDGWSDPQRRPILNFMAVTEGGPMFLKSIATEGETKST